MANVDNELRLIQNRDLTSRSQPSDGNVVALPGCVTADYGDGRIIIAATIADVIFSARLTGFDKYAKRADLTPRFHYGLPRIEHES